MLSFATDIRPLFRDKDVDSMRSMIDLSDYDAVKENADDIYQQLSEGNMPCDGAWPADRIARFRQWMDEGYRP
jgi:hypothetical protein